MESQRITSRTTSIMGLFFGMALASGLAIAFAEELEESFLREKLEGCLVLI
jgi:hypothetical protein